MTDTSTLPPVDHNRPPADDYAGLTERLGADYADLDKRKDELLAAFERAPAEVTDDDVAKQVSDFVVQINKAIKKAESNRVDEKEPYLEGGRRVDGWFKKITTPLQSAKKALEQRLTTYQRAVAAEERRRREEAERKAREEAERARREAAEAEAKMREEADLDAAVEAAERAKAAQEAARKAERDREAKAAELSRSRSDLGSVASLRTRWVGEMTDRATLDLEALRQHFSEDAIQKAINSFVKAGGRELRGAEIWEQTSTVVR